MNKRRKDSRINAYLKYSGIAFQLFAVLLIATLGGRYLDKKLALNFNLFTIAFSIFALVAFFYKLIKELEGDK